MTPTEEVAPNRWRAIGVCLVAAFMVLLDVSIVNVALPSIRAGLDASDSDLQWVMSGYALTFGLTLVPAGRLGDARGRRTIFMLPRKTSSPPGRRMRAASGIQRYGSARSSVPRR